MYHSMAFRVAISYLLALILLAFAGPAHGAENVTQDDVLSVRNGQFHLDGKPFAHIRCSSISMRFLTRGSSLNSYMLTNSPTNHFLAR